MEGRIYHCAIGLLPNPLTAKVLTKSCLQVNTSLDALSQVLSWFEGFNHPPVPRKVWLQCQLAVAEGFTNAVRHAHQWLPLETPIDLEVRLFDRYLELRIWDQGEPFNMEAFIAHLPSKINEEDEGGRGVMLMKTIASHLSYVRQADGRNCLLITKHYDDSLI